MKRKPVLVCLVIALVMSLLVFYSLMGAMTGVYVYDGRPLGMNGHGHVIYRSDGWYDVYYSSPRHAFPDAVKIEVGLIDISPGIWVMTLKRKDVLVIRAFASWNPVDIYRFTFGDFRSLGRKVVVP